MAVPVREVVAVFAATDSPTLPLPDPVAPDVIVSHCVLVAAVQEQPARVVTATLAVWPGATALLDVGLIE